MQGGRLGDPSKMAAAQYVSSNRQRQSMTRLRILCLWSETHTVACGVNGAWRLQRRSKSDKCPYQNALLLPGLGSRSSQHRMQSNKPTLFCSPTAFCLQYSMEVCGFEQCDTNMEKFCTFYIRLFELYKFNENHEKLNNTI